MSEVTTLDQAIGRAEVAAGIERASVALVVTNPNLEDNPIVYVNDAFEAITGYSRSAAIGRNCRFLQGEDTDPESVATIRRALKTGDEVSVDILNYTAAGRPFMNRLVISPISTEDGRVDYFLGIQKVLHPTDGVQPDPGPDDQLAAIQRRVKSHLSLIIGMIRRQTREQENAPTQFSMLARRVETLQLLYEEIALWEGQGSKSVDLGTYLTRVAHAIAHMEGRAGLRCTLDVAPVLSPVETATRLGLVLCEILTNAYRHAFEGLDRGVIDVRVSALSEGGLRLSVSDDGVGIPSGTPWPTKQSLGGRIVDGLVEGLDGTMIVNRGAAGTIIVIDVPVGAEDKV